MTQSGQWLSVDSRSIASALDFYHGQVSRKSQRKSFSVQGYGNDMVISAVGDNREILGSEHRHSLMLSGNSANFEGYMSILATARNVYQVDTFQHLR